jgi:hypothetical protein
MKNIEIQNSNPFHRLTAVKGVCPSLKKEEIFEVKKSQNFSILGFYLIFAREAGNCFGLDKKLLKELFKSKLL